MYEPQSAATSPRAESVGVVHGLQPHQSSGMTYGLSYCANCPENTTARARSIDTAAVQQSRRPLMPLLFSE